MSTKPLVLDLFCGLWGWTEGFIANGWQSFGIDLKIPRTIPEHTRFCEYDILKITPKHIKQINPQFIVCSSPCEQFSVHCMKHFHPNPPYPELGIKLFRHSQMLCESAGVPYVMENVRCAQKFVGNAVNHCGPFYLWGTGVPASFPPECFEVKKGLYIGSGTQARNLPREELRRLRKESRLWNGVWSSSKSKARQEQTANLAKIPPCISSYLATCALQML